MPPLHRTVLAATCVSVTLVAVLAATGSVPGPGAATTAGILALVGLLLYAYLHTRRVRRASRAAKAFAAGDLGARANLTGSDTIAQLGRALDAMADLIEDENRRLRLQHETFLRLAKDPAVAEGDLETASRSIAEAAAEICRVERVGVWLLDEAGRELRCIEQYERGLRRHSSGTVILAGDHSLYFDALRDGRVIDATDARNDPRTGSFFDSYLRPLGITSMLDATIRIAGRVVGVVCHEHVGAPRDWTADEVAFAGAIADQVAQVLLNRERVRARDELRNREAYFRSLIENNSDMITVFDEEGAIQYQAPSIRKVLGYDPEERVGKNVFERIHPDDRQKTVDVIRKAFAAPEETRYEEIRAQHRDGSWRTLECTGSIFESQEGQRFCIVNSRDVTRRRQAEDELQERERHFQTLIENALDIITVIDEGGTIRYLSPATEAVVGYRPEELVGKHALDLLHPGDRETLGRSIERMIAVPGSIHYAVARFRQRNGGWRVLESVGHAYRGADGRPIGVINSRDITDRTRAEDELAKARSMLEAAIESSPAGIIVADAPDVTIRLVNRAALRIRGRADQPLTDIPFELHPQNWRCFHPDGTPYRGEDLPLSRSVLKGETSHNVEVIIRRVSGEDRWVLANAAPVRNAEGEIVAGVVVFADITERRELELQFRHAQKMEAIGLLAGGVAHDFNNLLTVIGGYAQLLLGDVPRPGHGEALEEIVKAQTLAVELTRQLLAFGRRQDLQPCPLRLGDSVRALERMMRSLLGPRIELEIRPADDEGTIRADPGQIDQVILNLVVNARDAMPEGGRLAISTANVDLADPVHTRSATLEPGAYVVLTVSDTGHGMDAATLDRVFEPFFTTKPQEQGTGLGLSTVFGIVRQSQGQILLESRPGAGTRFHIHLPRCDEPPRAAPPEPEQSAGLRGTETILVAEDDDAVRSLVCTVLSDLGYSVLDAPDGTQALQRAADSARPVGLLLTDLVMPGMDGRELTRRFRAEHPDARVLYMSAFAESRSFALPTTERLVRKPFTSAMLARSVRETLDA